MAMGACNGGPPVTAVFTTHAAGCGAQALEVLLCCCLVWAPGSVDMPTGGTFVRPLDMSTEGAINLLGDASAGEVHCSVRRRKEKAPYPRTLEPNSAGPCRGSA